MMMTFDQFKEQADKIPYQYHHPPFLYALVKWLQPKTVVEVGTHIGMSAVWLARGLQELGRGRLYCIDSFCWVRERQEEQWNQNIRACGVDDVITLIKGRSTVVKWPDKVDMVFIDANHTYEACANDAAIAFTHGAETIAFHDSATYEGVNKYVERLRLELNRDLWDVMEVNTDQGLFIVHHRPPVVPLINFDKDEQWDTPK